MKLVRLCIPLAACGIAFAQGPSRPGPGPDPAMPQPQQGQMRPQNRPPGQPPMMGQPPMGQAPMPAGQMPRQMGAPPDFSALKSYLNLTDSQLRQMQQARDKARKDADEKEKNLRPQIQEKHNALAELMDKDNADATTVGKAMLEIRGLERQIRAAHEGVRNAGLSVLSAEQKAKFKAIQDAANLPAATREAQMLGLVQGPPPPDNPRPRMQQQGPNGPAPNSPGPNGPRPRMQGPERPIGPQGPPR